jgi:hypothetical protein
MGKQPIPHDDMTEFREPVVHTWQQDGRTFARVEGDMYIYVQRADGDFERVPFDELPEPLDLRPLRALSELFGVDLLSHRPGAS